jgi:DNA-binding PadR family transcriptional regulator
VYILHRIAVKPAHGYEIIQDIQTKTEGAWNPGAGSIYPILKKLVSEGLIKAETPGPAEDRHVFQITPKGAQTLKEMKENFANFGQRWSSLRGLFMDMIDPEKTIPFVIEGSLKQFEFVQHVVKSRMDALPSSEIDYLLKEYKLNLERQLSWTNQTLSDLGTKPVVVRREKRGGD